MFSAERKGVNGHKEYAKTYGRKIETATKKTVQTVKKIVNHFSWKETKVEGDGLGSGERKEAVITMSKTATNV